MYCIPSSKLCNHYNCITFTIDNHSTCNCCIYNHQQQQQQTTTTTTTTTKTQQQLSGVQQQAATHLLQPHSLWLFSLTVVNSQRTGRCTALLGMYGVHETSATHRFCFHCTLGHPQLYQCCVHSNPLDSHPIPSMSLLNGDLKPLYS